MNIFNDKSPYHQRDIIEFVTVAVEFCAFTEGAYGKDYRSFIDTMHKILPLLYLKGILLPTYEKFDDTHNDMPEYVSMENYDIIRSNVAAIMAEKDTYLEVFVEDMKYSDSPILSSVSENIADIYQDLKNFVCAYKDGTEEMRYDSIVMCKYNFENYWGQRLVNVLRALHEIYYDDNIENEDY